MNRPGQRGHKCDPKPAGFFHLAGAQPFEREAEKGDRSGGMPKNAREVITERRVEADRIVKCITEALQRTVEIRAARVGEEKVRESLPDRSPAANQRIAQNQRLIVPDKLAAERGRIAAE